MHNDGWFFCKSHVRNQMPDFCRTSLSWTIYMKSHYSVLFFFWTWPLHALPLLITWDFCLFLLLSELMQNLTTALNSCCTVLYIQKPSYGLSKSVTNWDWGAVSTSAKLFPESAVHKLWLIPWAACVLSDLSRYIAWSSLEIHIQLYSQLEVRLLPY